MLIIGSDNDIPQRLRAPVGAALEWLNAERAEACELTGLVDYEQALDASPDEMIELGMVLCDGNLCDREQVEITPADGGFRFNKIARKTREIPSLLDPPLGIRSTWLDTVLGDHQFTVLLFYRGLW